MEPDSTPPAHTECGRLEPGGTGDTASSLLSLGSLPLEMPAAMWPGHSGNPVKRPTRWGAESYCKQPARSQALGQQPHKWAICDADPPALAKPRNLAPRTLCPSPARTTQLGHSWIPDLNRKIINVWCFEPLSFGTITNTTLLCWFHLVVFTWTW